MKTSDVLIAAKRLQLINAAKTDVMFHGYSMEPLLTEGDRINTEEVDIVDIRIGDIITYLYEDKYPTRRVVLKRHNCLGLWCDNWPERRFSTDASNVLARVVSRERDGQQLLNTDNDWIALTNKGLRDYQIARIKSFFQRIFQRLLRN